MTIQIRDFLMSHMGRLCKSSILFLSIAACVCGLNEIGVIEGGRDAPLRKVGDVSATIGFFTSATAYVGGFLHLLVKDIQETTKEASRLGSDEDYSDIPF